MLKVENLYAGYNGIDVISNINFEIRKGESFCVLGPNGCGKSTLLKSIARIIDYRGAVTMDSDDISALPRKALAKKIALLSQGANPAGSAQIFFPYTVYETVSMGRYAWSQGFLKNLTTEDKNIIEEVTRKLDIWEIKDRMIDELSGGTLQRVFLARTLAQMPEIILLDEPANHLDLKHQIELLEFLKTWVKENNKILIGVFHDLNLARLFGDSAVILCNGSIAAGGRINDVLKSEILNAVYGIDIYAFIQKSFYSWK
ncbi:MAG: ABC transporter ATP-binding protein [Treponema sp.]|jgi:iron complex transport system ATP-binding protein|nr:ABC transporter ATP-binding protein [Treponema sp.]